ncbi:aldehyde dehydrogenase family protein [Lentzea sp. NPDC004782]|uniref:aldehyde dehydrogenase family protein n=1 Tax=Lentzea sp. NPDC004782 TaxID=3154458 RepID=UPI0033AAEAAE
MNDHAAVLPHDVAALGRKLGEALRLCADELAAAVTTDVPFRIEDVLKEINATSRFLEVHLGALGAQLVRRRPICTSDEWAAIMLPSNILASGIRTITELLIGGNKVLVRMTGRASHTSAVVQNLFDDIVPGRVIMERTRTGPDFLDHVMMSESVRFALVFGGEELGDDLLRRVRQGVTKKVVFEGPGKDPVIVLAGAQIDDVAQVTAKAKLAVAGQRCIAPENVIAHHTVHDELVERLVTAFEAATVGSVISPKVPEMVRRQLADAQEKGARIACGGTIEGQHVAATIVTNATQDMSVFQDETFAPLLAVASFGEPEEAVNIARSSRFGLACSIFGDEAEAVATELRGEPYAHRVDDLVFGRYGHVTVNSGLPAAAVRTPFGGYGKSGWIWENGELRQGPKLPAFEATRM